MKAINYSEWESTARVIQLVSQMVGKFKLAQMPAQPEWQQVTLPLTSRGFTSGLVPCGEGGCTVDIDLFESKVTATHTDGKTSSFPFRAPCSIAEYYADFIQMLADIGLDVPLYPVPQEMDTDTPFDEDTEQRHYDPQKARECFLMFVFAHNTILDFVSEYRCKKAVPELFWGTFDVTGLLFSGKPAPYPGEGLIESVAFDEELIEFGFWPGDSSADKPSFFVLPYPFMEKDLTGTLSKNSKGVYSTEQAEYFLSLEDALSSEDPHKEVVEFFKETFAILAREGDWADHEWYTTPLWSHDR